MNRTPLPPLAACAALLLAASSCADEAPRWASAGGLALTRVVAGLESPVHLTALPGDPRLFVVEQRGRIRVIENGRLRDQPFLDLVDRVGYGGERGLLSLAFHPRYADNGWLFVNYTDRNGNTRVERYHVAPDGARADPASARLVIGIRQPYANHNGGHVLFGPDGMLWIGMGDGGSAGDPHGNAQDPATLLGDILRLDVDHGDPYAIPRGNAFPSGAAARPEIWATGVRNPWRLWIDAPTRMLYVADVGQNQWEEVTVLPIDRVGANLGWNLVEGRHPYRGGRTPEKTLLPQIEYPHQDGCSITGGVVYRGRRIPGLQGFYLFSDYCRGWLRGFRFEGGAARDLREWRLPSKSGITSFGVGGDGEVYVLVQSGEVWRIDPAPAR